MEKMRGGMDGARCGGRNETENEKDWPLFESLT